MAGKTRSSLPTDQRRRNTTIPGMANGSGEDHQAQCSPSETEEQIAIKQGFSSHHKKMAAHLFQEQNSCNDISDNFPTQFSHLYPATLSDR